GHEARRELGRGEVVAREVVGRGDLVRLARHQRGPLAVEVDQLLGDRLPLGRVGRQQRLGAAAAHHQPELPAEVEAVLHRHVHALAGLGAVGVAGVAGEEHPRRAVLPFGDVVELVGHSVPDLVDAVPRDLAHLDRVRVQDRVGAPHDLLERGLAHLVVVVGRHLAEVDVHAAEVAALARDVQDVPGAGADRALDAPVGEVGVDEHVHDAPRVLGEVADVLAADRVAHAAAGAVAPGDVPGPHGPGLAGARPGRVPHRHLDGVAAVVVHAQPEELDAVVGHDPPRAGDALVKHPDVPLISFTGESRTGQIIFANAAPHLKGLSMELGGKSPAVVFADADLDAAIDATIFGVFSLNGERCTAGSRILVQREIYDTFVERYAAQAARVRVGLPHEKETEVGALVHPEHFQKVMSYIEIGRSEGRLVAGGGRPEAFPTGNFVAPTVFADVPPTAR